MSSVVYNMDCMEAMRGIPDKYFDLAVVDPPYGSGLADGGVDTLRGTVRPIQARIDHLHSSRRKDERERMQGGGRRTHYTFGIKKTSKNYENRRNLGREVRKKIISWDVAPKQEYFDELFRVSRNQIIWGGATTSIYRRQGASSYGGKRTFQKKAFR